MENLRNNIYCVIDPGDKRNFISRLYDTIMVSAIIIGLVPLAFREQKLWMDICDKLSCILYVMDYLLRWICADKIYKKGKISFLLYPFQPMAIIDILSILPSVTVLNNAFKLFRATRFLKILRIVRAARYYVPLQIITAAIKKEISTLMTIFVFACFYILLTALIMFNVEEEINPTTGNPVFDTFFDAIYWSACTLTTVGYGDICPVSDIGKFFCVMSSLVGVAIIALPSGVITASYLEEIKERKTNQHKQ